jgi:regulator of protease activity HflC (stomatin/prohibitin superfamily)
MSQKETSVSTIIISAILIIVALIALLMWGWPQYKIYSARLDGEAILARAISAKQAEIETARAKYESAKLLADAEELRADGAARAIDKVSHKLQGNDAYLRYLWITEVAPNENGRTLIYVPSNGLLPVTEQSRAATMSLEDALKATSK